MAATYAYQAPMNSFPIKAVIQTMTTYQVALLNPKAGKLLQDLADLNLISIEKTATDSFLKVVDRLRNKAATKTLTLEEITKEVEAVRTKRYAKSKA